MSHTRESSSFTFKYLTGRYSSLGLGAAHGLTLGSGATTHGLSVSANGAPKIRLDPRLSRPHSS